jgi:hypothetical protein
VCTSALVVLVIRECTLIFYVIMLFCNFENTWTHGDTVL